MFRKPSLVIFTAVAVLIAAVFASARLSAAPASPAQRQASLLKLPRATSAGQMTLFGHIKLLKPAGPRFELRFDPAWWLTGVTAQRAKGSTDVPNDYYILDESHRLLTYVVRANAHVTVLTAGTNTRAITVARLADRVKSGKTKSAGFWIQVGDKYPSPVLSLDQQYQP
jgi:hypothetical protein